MKTINTSMSYLQKITNFFKKENVAKKSRQALMLKMVEPLLDRLDDTTKSMHVNNLSYKALKRKKNQAFKLVEAIGMAQFLFDFEYWITQSDSYKSKHRITFSIDGTKTGRKYGIKMPMLRTLYDYVDKCYVKTHELYICKVNLGKKVYIIDFILVKKKNKSDKKSAHNKIAKQMLIRFIKLAGKQHTEQLLRYTRVSLDGAWGNGDMISFLNNFALNYVVVKSGGKDLVNFNNQIMTLKELKELLIDLGSFQSFNECHNLKGDYIKVVVLLVNTGMAIQVVLRRTFTKKKKRQLYLMLLSPNIDMHPFKIAQCYGERWGIEETIKECKDVKVCDITGYSLHSSNTENIEMFLDLRLCLYMCLNWYRVENCRPSKTSIFKVANRFEKDIGKMGYKRLWYIFSG